jgi:anti-sigma factor RsiW
MDEVLDRHIGGDLLDRYAASHHLPESELAALEAHLLVCPSCQDRFAELDGSVQALSTILERRGQMQTDFVHQTEDGPVRLLLTRTVDRGWVARFQGRELDGRREFRTAVGAKRWLARSFAEMFPKHRCTRRCRAAPEPSGLVD